MNPEVLYSNARRTWKRLNILPYNLAESHFTLLKWILEVALSDPEKMDTGLINNHLKITKRSFRTIQQVQIGASYTDYYIVLFMNGEVGFPANLSYNMALRITAAFEKWCELLKYDIFKVTASTRL